MLRSLSKMVVGLGFEPRKSKTADLQSAPFGHFGTLPCVVKRKQYLKNELLCQREMSFFCFWLTLLHYMC